MILASILDQYTLLNKPVQIGAAPVRGFANAQRIRRAHEDCRAAVKDARDAFIDLSGMLSSECSPQISETIGRLNRLYPMIVSSSYGTSLAAASAAMTVVDEFICTIGANFDYRRAPRSFEAELRASIPGIGE
jgi:hypothetical protein